MKRIIRSMCILVVFCFAAVCAQAQTTCPVNPATGNAVAQLITPTNGSTLPAGAVTFQWCNASADYFLVIESVPGAGDIFNAFTGGVGPGAGVVSVTLGPACALGRPTGCIPAQGETIHVTLFTVKNKQILSPSPFQYTFTAASSAPAPSPALTSTAVASQAVAFSSSIQNVTLTATVAGSAVNEGTMTFQVMDGASNIGSAVTSGTLTNGNASVIYPLPAGTVAKPYTIKGSYSGGPNFQPSSGLGTLSVNVPAPSPALTSTAVAGQTASFSSSIQNVTLTATVAGSAVNEGTMTFQVMDGATNIGSAVTSGALTNGIASVIYPLPAGTGAKTYTVQASYSGGPNFQPSSGTGTLTISAPSPTAALTSTAVASQALTFSSSIQNVTLTATVAGAAVNQGTVTFQVMEGASKIGNAVTSATVTNGVASVIYPLPGGTVPKSYTIQAAYSGGPNFQASTGTATLSIGANPSLTMTFHLPPDGGSALSSGAGALAVSYGEMSWSTASDPVAIANFGYSNGALVTEAGVPAATVLTSARLFVDYSADRNSGFALVNPGSSPMTIQADLKDAQGATVASTTVPLGARSHTAMFVNELLTTLPSPFVGTVTLTSGHGFAAVNLSTAMSGRSEMLFSALPVADLSNPPVGSRLVLPQIVDGGGNPTQILLMNPSSTALSIGKVELFDDSGAPLALDFGAATGPQNVLDFSLAPDGMVKFATTGKGALRVGYAVVTVSAGSLPVGNGVFQFNQASGLVSQAGVPNSPQTTSARMYVEVASAPLNRNTGIAMVNRNATASTLTLTLNGLDGSAQSSTLTLGANEHAAKFITELFAGLPADFGGVLNIASSQPSSFLTLRLTTNERGETIYSTLPVADLNNPPQGIQILPQIVNGGGYKTQTIVLSTSTGPGDVFINFFDESGRSVPLSAIQ